MPTPTDAVTRGVRLGIVAYVLWGLLTIYWKQLEGFDAVELIAWRMACAAVVMAVVVTMRGTWPSVVGALCSRRSLRSLTLSALLLTVNWGSYVWAVLDDRVIETALGYFIAPLGTMAIGVLVLDETPTRAQRLAFGLAAVAVVILTVSAGRPPWIALVIAATWSSYALSKRQVDLDAIDSMAGETLVLVAPALVALAVLGRRSGSVANSADVVEWAFVLGTGLITALPLTLFASAARSIPFTLLGPLNLIVPVIGFGLGWLLYDEDVPLLRFVGFGFVWVALVVVMLDRVRSARRSASLRHSAAPL